MDSVNQVPTQTNVGQDSSPQYSRINHRRRRRRSRTSTSRVLSCLTMQSSISLTNPKHSSCKSQLCNFTGRRYRYLVMIFVGSIVSSWKNQPHARAHVHTMYISSFEDRKIWSLALADFYLWNLCSQALLFVLCLILIKPMSKSSDQDFQESLPVQGRRR